MPVFMVRDREKARRARSAYGFAGGYSSDATLRCRVAFGGTWRVVGSLLWQEREGHAGFDWPA